MNHFGRPALSALALLTLSTPGTAQSPLLVAAPARATPGGVEVASLFAGATVTTLARSGTEVLVSVQGWVDESRLAGKRDSFPASVGGTQTLRIRGAPSLQGAIFGELRPGAGVVPLGMKGTWMQVRRNAWVPAAALGRPGTAALVTSAPPARSAEPGPPGSMSASRPGKLLSAPHGRELGEVAAGTIVQPLARERGWLRVRVEGWVPERDFEPADSSFAANFSAADLRANPEGSKGKMVRWEVQVLSFQTADPLRRDLARDEPYLLAKGPGAENALLYLAIPSALMVEARTIPPLTKVIITARVRTGRSEPAGTPILDLRSISKR